MAGQTVYRSSRRFVLESIEGIVLTPVVVLMWPVLRGWLANWGSAPAERQMRWPGDALAPDATEVYTRAIGIAAPPEVVWRWVVQFGLDRAGFYSYEFLERLTGIPVRNVESILPEHQNLKAGHEIKLHPDAPGIPVGLIEPGRYLCFGEAGDATAGTPDPRRSWSIYLVSSSPDSTRVVLRSCIEALRAPTLMKRLGAAVEVPVDFAMEQRMLRTVRRLSEKCPSDVLDSPIDRS